ncbi:sugar phosphate isomerase/epimerase [Alteromonas sp. C1M14]|uniref:sugar phosphate isomerase/epimerase family protein n=1 Tax=Alteromonas sp. C1M14 TaxID=2841567 RepID=UPI001C09C323|nr:sugar phosphate isomerase/epimerase [Alteromonas sp. C1M14]MBU2979570.1 sugar phosphate isomerase/epimerase [Alteromonas sp. C1M14]
MSVQLWSVNDALQEDFEGTLTKLAQMGFDGVELAGRFGPFADDPCALKRCLNNLGLEVSGAHVAIETLDEENQEATVRFYQQLGVDLLIIPYDERAWHPQQVNHFIDDLNRLSTQLARHNMGIGFHNHDKEFGAYKNATYWDYIAENTHQQVALQQDVGWITYAGHNPTLYVNRYADRLPSIHFKACALENAAAHIPLIGQDSVDWAPLIATTTSLATVPWVVLEQEVYPCGLTSMQAVSASKKGLDELLSQALAQ